MQNFSEEEDNCRLKQFGFDLCEKSAFSCIEAAVIERLLWKLLEFTNELSELFRILEKECRNSFVRIYNLMQDIQNRILSTAELKGVCSQIEIVEEINSLGKRILNQEALQVGAARLRIEIWIFSNGGNNLQKYRNIESFRHLIIPIFVSNESKFNFFHLFTGSSDFYNKGNSIESNPSDLDTSASLSHMSSPQIQIESKANKYFGKQHDAYFNILPSSFIYKQPGPFPSLTTSRYLQQTENLDPLT